MKRFPRLLHRRTATTLGLLALAAASAAGQGANYPYVLRTFAGTYPLGDGGPAVQALLSSPDAVAVDDSANLYVLDSANYRIRRITPSGTISTTFQLSVIATDMKLGTDGTFYLASPGLVFKIAPKGLVTALAGNGTLGFNGDGGLAVNALVGVTGGIALDPAGNIYFSDANRIRVITLDGKIRTIAGTGIGGYDGDNKPALSAQLNTPTGLAFDQSNNLYFADKFNYRVRKIDPSGIITTIAGNGSLGRPASGPATATPMGAPHAIAIDVAGGVFFTDVTFPAIRKIGTDGSLIQVAGTQTFGYSDGPAIGTYFFNPLGLAIDSAGNVFIAETGSNRVRLLTSTGVMTIAGRLHYAGDGGLAIFALLNNPGDTAIDAQGNLFILDAGNFRVRQVTPNGRINTFAGNGLLGTPVEGVQATSAPLPQLYSMAGDGQGNLYLGVSQKILMISAAGVVTTFAGNPSAPPNSGDGGPATNAGMNVVSSLAVDGAGAVYVGDCCNGRVRKITTDGMISPFAGNGTLGYTGDAGLAINARLGGPVSLAADRNGNVYLGDGANNVVRVVNQAGIITTVAGNGTKGTPADGAPAKSSPLPGVAGLAVDASGYLYIQSGSGSIYRVDSSARIRVVSGGGSAAVADGLLANATAGFSGKAIQLDASGDLYAIDSARSMMWKLVLDSPTGLLIADGNNQTAPAGTALPKPLKVTVNGRGGLGVPGITVNFAVVGGSATLSALSLLTDNTGSAAMGVTLGPVPGNVVITAAIAGSNLGSVQFMAMATINPSCGIGVPIITSVRSLGDFGALPSFGAGSWLEVKGSNLAINTRLWSPGDFMGANAPTSLDGSSVSINANAGFVEYISPAQINVQAPADPATGPVQLVVTNCAGASAPATVQKVTMAPGMLAPAKFNIGGKQYLVALFPDGVTYVGDNGLIAGASFRPAKPGESITAYGIGFGPVTPPLPPGVVVSAANSISGLAVSFGLTPATTSYAGLAPDNIGLYQFNITVPNVPDGDYQINMSVAGVPVTQTVYLTVHQ